MKTPDGVNVPRVDVSVKEDGSAQGSVSEHDDEHGAQSICDALL